MLQQAKIMGKFIQTLTIDCGNQCFKSFEKPTLEQQEESCFKHCFALTLKLQGVAEPAFNEGTAKHAGSL